jgi:hypothetical protein
MAMTIERTNAQVPESAPFPASGIVSCTAAGTPTGNQTVESWEIHSELVLVSPEVRKHALEILARERSVHLFRYQALEGERKHPSPPAPFAIALGVYVARALVHTLVPASVAIGGTIAIAVLLELLRRLS